MCIYIELVCFLIAAIVPRSNNPLSFRHMALFQLLLLVSFGMEAGGTLHYKFTTQRSSRGACPHISEEATTQRQPLFKPFHTPAQQNIRYTSWLRAEGYPRAFPKLDTFVGKTFSWSPGRLSEAVPTRSRAGFSQMKKPGETAHAIGPAHPEGPRQRDCHQP